MSFLPPVSPPVRMENLYSCFKDFHDIRYLRIFRKFVEKIKILLKSDKNYREYS